MSLSPPIKVGKLQTALHTKAKNSPDYRFYALYWAAPHFLVHLKWEFVKRHLIHLRRYVSTCVLLILSSQDELNSFGVA